MHQDLRPPPWRFQVPEPFCRFGGQHSFGGLSGRVQPIPCVQWPGISFFSARDFKIQYTCNPFQIRFLCGNASCLLSHAIKIAPDRFHFPPISPFTVCLSSVVYFLFMHQEFLPKYFCCSIVHSASPCQKVPPTQN